VSHPGRVQSTFQQGFHANLDLASARASAAGIAGLAAATALRHHNVTILEQSRLKEEVGAAIHLGPNASKIAIAWGLNLESLNSPEVNWVSLSPAAPGPARQTESLS
jgi:hypothetical protein